MTETRPSEVAIGVPVHNGARHLRQALDTLLSQRFEDFNVLILDDGSTDGSDDIIRCCAERDARVQHVRQGERRGLIESWRRTAQLCHERFQPTFFAWYSDHDWVDPDWLGALHATMRGSRTVALAHARTRLADADGHDAGRDMELVETQGLDLFRRLDKVVFSRMGAGDAVYGLFRWSVLHASGIFRNELMPDRLLVAEVNLHGEIAHVENALRFRRRTHEYGDARELVDRQMHTLFPDRRDEDSTVARPYTSHATALLRLALGGAGDGWELDLARVYLGILYYQRSLTKFREPLLRERAIPIDSDPDPFRELILANLDTPALMSTASHRAARAAWAARKRALGQDRDEALAKVRSLDQALAEVTAERAGLEDELTATRQALSTQEEANASLERAMGHQAEELAFLKARYRWTRVPGAVGLLALKLVERWKVRP